MCVFLSDVSQVHALKRFPTRWLTLVHPDDNSIIRLITLISPLQGPLRVVCLHPQTINRPVQSLSLTSSHTIHVRFTLASLQIAGAYFVHAATFLQYAKIVKVGGGIHGRLFSYVIQISTRRRCIVAKSERSFERASLHSSKHLLKHY